MSGLVPASAVDAMARHYVERIGVAPNASWMRELLEAASPPLLAYINQTQGGQMSEPANQHKGDAAEAGDSGFEECQRLVAFLVHKSGGEVTISRREFLDFASGGSIESSIDVGSGNITIAYMPAK